MVTSRGKLTAKPTPPSQEKLAEVQDELGARRDELTQAELKVNESEEKLKALRKAMLVAKNAGTAYSGPASSFPAATAQPAPMPSPFPNLQPPLPSPLTSVPTSVSFKNAATLVNQMVTAGPGVLQNPSA